MTAVLTETWVAICRYDDLLPERGAAALVDGEQVALFRTYEGEVFAVSNYDPFSEAYVMSRGIVGSKGDLRLEPAYDYAGAIVHHLTIDGETQQKTYEKRDQFAPELIYFSNCILEDEEPEPSIEEGLLDVRVIEAVLSAARTGQAIELQPAVRQRRPAVDQAMYVRPFDKPPKTIDAPSPSAS